MEGQRCATKGKRRGIKGESSRFKNANLQFENKRIVPKRNGKHIANKRKKEKAAFESPSPTK